MVRTKMSLGGKILASFLLLDLILLAVGVLSLISQSGLHDRIAAVSSRDLVPLSHLRDAQNASHSIVISGFAGSQSPDPKVKAAMAKAVKDYQVILDQSFQQLVATEPAAMQAASSDLIATHQGFVAADLAFKAGATGPNAEALGNKASDAYGATEPKFAGLAGAFLKDADVQRQEVNAVYQRSQTTTWSLLVLGIVVGLVLAAGISRSVRRRTAIMLAGLDQVAAGDLTQTVEVSGTDEIAQMAAALNRSVLAVRAAMTEVSGSAQALAQSAIGLSSSADETARSVQEAAAGVDSVTSGAGAVTDVVGTVAASTVELGSSIRDISQNAQEAARVAVQAVEVVRSTNDKISQLGNSSQEIGNVIQVIQNIAAQTSLLALNATIEAARAGEAGRGFAVVAGEVKDLARETAEATDSVINRVQAIQQDTEGAVTAIGEIGEIIQQINSFQSTIAAAVEEQSVTTDSIGISIGQALAVTKEIAATTSQVAVAARGSANSVSSTRSLAGNVATMGEQLRRVVSGFRI